MSNNFVLLLQNYKIKLLVTIPYKSKHQRFNDSCIMNDTLKIMSSKIQRQKINAYRRYLDVTFLSDITSINGKFLLPGVLTGDKGQITNSNQECTTQDRPYNKSRKLWARTTTSLYCIKSQSKILCRNKKLGHWLDNPTIRTKIYPLYYSPSLDEIFETT